MKAVVTGARGFVGRNLSRHLGDLDVEVASLDVGDSRPVDITDADAVALLFGGVRKGGRVPLYCPEGVLGRVQAMEPTEDLREVFDPPRRSEIEQVDPWEGGGTNPWVKVHLDPDPRQTIAEVRDP